MPVFKDESEVYQFIGGIFVEALADPDIGPMFTVDMPAKQVLFDDDTRNGPKPVVEMFMKADVAHRFWLGKVNISLWSPPPSWSLRSSRTTSWAASPSSSKDASTAGSVFPCVRWTASGTRASPGLDGQTESGWHRIRELQAWAEART